MSHPPSTVRAWMKLLKDALAKKPRRMRRRVHLLKKRSPPFSRPSCGDVQGPLVYLVSRSCELSLETTSYVTHAEPA